ncbi:hypothetical protein MKEN_00747800 [Mycena kentingensis (nom. inval.)]|nr:hypothetical protein MKEN_00747800 [Mycena kentingensis (nom. inval.)]
MSTAIHIAGEVFRATASASAAYPPLQAATGLVTWLEQSYRMFTANREEIHALGTYLRELEDTLKGRPGPHPSTTQANEFVQAVRRMQNYLLRVSEKPWWKQFVQRSKISRKLSGLRTRIQEEFQNLLLSMLGNVDAKLDAAEKRLVAINTTLAAVRAAQRRDTANSTAFLQLISQRVTGLSAGLGVLGPAQRAVVDFDDYIQVNARKRVFQGLQMHMKSLSFQCLLLSRQISDLNSLDSAHFVIALNRTRQYLQSVESKGRPAGRDSRPLIIQLWVYWAAVYQAFVAISREYRINYQPILEQNLQAARVSDSIADPTRPKYYSLKPRFTVPGKEVDVWSAVVDPREAVNWKERRRLAYQKRDTHAHPAGGP